MGRRAGNRATKSKERSEKAKAGRDRGCYLVVVRVAFERKIEKGSQAMNLHMNQQSRITLNPDTLVGKPIIRGTRLTVEFIIDLLAQGWSTDEILRNYPGISLEDIQACLSYASAALKAEKVYAIPV